MVRFSVGGPFPISAGSGGEIIITQNVNIVGNGAAQTVLDAQSTNRHFQIAPGVMVTISGVTMRRGRVIDTPGVDLVFVTDANGPGGYAPCVAYPFNQILNGPGTDDDQTEDSGHPQGGRGGAIFNLGNLTVTGSAFRDNFAEKAGGAIYTTSRTTTRVRTCSRPGPIARTPSRSCSPWPPTAVRPELGRSARPARPSTS